MNKMLAGLLVAALFGAGCDEHKPDKERIPKPKAAEVDRQISRAGLSAIHPGSAGSPRR